MGTKLYAMGKMKCPRCHEGDLFETSTFSFQKSFEMPDQCQHCGQSYMPEPGFYYGAMFISYAIWGWFCIFFALTLIWGFGMGIYGAFGVILLLSVIFYVWLFRISRSIWINMMVKYDPKFAQK